MMQANRINIDAMYDTATAGELMGGINRRDVCTMINEGIIRGHKRPPVRSKKGVGQGTVSQLVVSGAEILRFIQSMKPAGKEEQAAPVEITRRRRVQARQEIPEY